MLNSDVRDLESDISNAICRLMRELLNDRCFVYAYTEHNERHIDIEYSTGAGQYDQRKCCFSGNTYEEVLNEALSYINECDYLSGIRYPHKKEVMHKIKVALEDECCETIEMIKFEECPATIVNGNMQCTFNTTLNIQFDTPTKSVGYKIDDISEILSNLGFVVRFDGCGLDFGHLIDGEFTRYTASFNVTGVLPCS
jgi:hypothetical protein